MPALFWIDCEDRVTISDDRLILRLPSGSEGQALDSIPIGSRLLQPNRQLLAEGERISIGARALSIISVLARSDGEVVTKDELLEAVWPGITVEENALQVHIVALRKALGDDAYRLVTIRGVGYRLDLGHSQPLAEQAEPDADRIVPPAVSLLPPGSRDQQVELAPPTPTRFRRPPPLWLAFWATFALALGIFGWWLIGSELGSRQTGPIPVIVRTFTASNANDTTEAALAAGIADELIVRLRRVQGLRIAAAEADGSVPGEVFSKAYVVDGNIRSVGERLRVTTRFVNPDGEIIWSQTFNRRLADIFEVQETIAAAISEALGVSLDVGANSEAYGGTNNPEAFAAYLEYRANRFNPDQSIPTRYLERALAIDPDYTKALAGLASSYGVQSNLAPSRSQALALLEKYDESSARAVTTNPGSWIAQSVRGGFHNESREFSAAAASFQRVQSLDDGTDPELRETLALYSLLNGRANQALVYLDSNEFIDPNTRQRPLRIWASLHQGRYEEAIALFNRITANDPNDPFPFTDGAFWSYLMLRRESEAIRFAEQHDVPWLPVLRDFQANPQLATFTPAQLRDWANRKYGDSGHFQLANLALFASYYEKPNLALNLLRLAFDRPGGYGIGILWHPAMSPTRRTSGFKQLATDLGLVEYWRTSGNWPDACRPLSAADFVCE